LLASTLPSFVQYLELCLRLPFVPSQGAQELQNFFVFDTLHFE
jgi:hypothetical protein